MGSPFFSCFPSLCLVLYSVFLFTFIWGYLSCFRLNFHFLSFYFLIFSHHFCRYFLFFLPLFLSVSLLLKMMPLIKRMVRSSTCVFVFLTSYQSVITPFLAVCGHSAPCLSHFIKLLSWIKRISHLTLSAFYNLTLSLIQKWSKHQHL